MALSKCTFTAPKGKVFAGWAKSKNGDALYTNCQKVKKLTSKNKGTVKLYAVWVTPKTYKIKYDTNGGKLSENAKTTYKSGTGAALPSATKKGYAFAGWYTDEKFESEKMTAIKPWQIGNIKLYAKWKKITTAKKRLPSGDLFLSLNYNADLTTTALILCDNNLFVDFFFQIGNMGNDADEFVALTQIRQGFECLLQRFIVK